MKFTFEYRPSESPFVDSVWRSYSMGRGSFISNAYSQWEMVVTKQKDKRTFSLRGPETHASPAPIPEDAEFIGIVFKHGVYMPQFPIRELVNNELHLGEHVRNSFHFLGSTWEFPTFENVDTFINRLTRTDQLDFDQVVDDTLRGKIQNLSLRSVQRRFLSVTGLSYKTIQQIERAHHATALLQSGVPIIEAATQAGYFDQAHLTNSLRRLYGQTPAQLIQANKSP